MKSSRAAFALLLLSALAHAQPCIETASLEVTVRQLEPLFAIPGFPVQIAGTVTRVKRACSSVGRTPVDKFAWRVTDPTGAAVAVPGATTTLRTSFTPARPGKHRVTLTGCPAVCRISLITALSPTNKPIRETVELTGSRTIEIDVLTQAQLPPAFAPPDKPSPLLRDAQGVLRRVPATTPRVAEYQFARNACSGSVSIGIGDAAQWFTTAAFPPEAPAFTLAEGRVYHSHVSRKDHPASHHSNDANSMVEVDPPYQHLLVADTPSDKSSLLPLGGLEFEWERGQYPEAFRPIQGDRISALGYHVIDCGHEKYTEIHPPVAVAVHRPRPILLPERVAFEEGGPEMRLGTNVVVPGIVTDLWANLNGGQALDCENAAIHNPTPILVPSPSPGQPPIRTFRCVPQPARGAKFQFHIYLPINPATRGRALDLPPIPRPALWIGIENHPDAAALGAQSGIQPRIIERQLDVEAPYVKVEVDLSTLTAASGGRYAKRIRAAWVYPDADAKNFGLRSFRAQLKELKVTDDGDPFLKGDGDWRFWAGIPSIEKPWTRLIDCDGCVEETTYRPGSGVFRPGQVAPDGGFGGPVLLFGTQRGMIQFGGFEADTLTSDDTGTVIGVIFAATGGSGLSKCNDQTVGGLSNLDPSTSSCAAYSISWEFVPSGSNVLPSLSPEGRAFAARLVIRTSDPGRMTLPLDSALFQLETISPQKRALTDERRGEVDNWQAELAVPRLRTALAPTAPDATSAAAAERFAAEIRKHALQQLGPNPSAKHRRKVALELQELKKALPEAVYRKHLCEVETGAPCP